MATLEPADGSEDVNDFLRRIRELGDKRDREDAERTRKLEEDILEGRRQREGDTCLFFQGGRGLFCADRSGDVV